MVKIIFYLFFLSFISFSVFVLLTISKDNQNIIDIDNRSLSEPIFQVPSNTPAVLSATTPDDLGEWKKYEDTKSGYSLSYPGEFNLQNEESGIAIYKKDNDKQIILIDIKERSLVETETINTAAEKDINEKISKNPEKFSVSETITPIAIGSITAFTFKLVEISGENTYFYIPRGDKNFLEISIRGENNLSASEISLVDRIVYSLEIK